jgi:hypothetical protein
MDLKPFITMSAQFLLFYTSTNNHILTPGDQIYWFPLISYLGTFYLFHSPVESPIDEQIIHDLIIFLLLPSTVMLVSTMFGFNSTTFSNLDGVALVGLWIKLYFFW